MEINLAFLIGPRYLKSESMYEFDLKCDECGSGKIALDDGMKYCKECGFILDDFLIAK